MATTDGIRIEEGVVFGRGGGRDLKCDIYTPANIAPNAPAVLMLYGGGWRMGERGRMRDASTAHAKHGFVCVAGEYRLTPESPWPAQIHDVKASIRWMRANAARLGIDPSKISIQGHSAGAHLGMLAAATPNLPEFEGDGGNPGVSSEVAAIVAVYPPTVFHVGDQRPSGSTPASALMFEAATEEKAKAASPMAYARADFPPTFMLHGTKDTVVPVTASLRMYDALTAAGAKVEMHIYSGLPHGFGRLPSMLDMVQAESAGFINRNVVAPSKLAAELAEVQAQMAAQQQAAAAAR
jgi:acetyl esterase/lipase